MVIAVRPLMVYERMAGCADNQKVDPVIIGRLIVNMVGFQRLRITKRLPWQEAYLAIINAEVFRRRTFRALDILIADLQPPAPTCVSAIAANISVTVYLTE